MWLSVLFWLFSSAILLFPVFHVMKEFRLTLSGTDMEIRGRHIYIPPSSSVRETHSHPPADPVFENKG